MKNIGLSSYRIYNKKDHCIEKLSKEEYDVFINLSNNKKFIIQKAGRSNTVVTIDGANYVKEMEKILSDTNKFLKVTFNPNSSIKECLDDLLNNNYLLKED